MENSVEIYFGVYGDFEPEDFTNFIGLSPTHAWKKETRAPEPQLPKESFWKFSSGRIIGDVIDAYKISQALIERLEPSTHLIQQALRKWKLQSVLQTVLFVSTDSNISTPIIGYSADTISFLSSMRASIDLDIYRSWLDDEHNSAEQGAAANP